MSSILLPLILDREIGQIKRTDYRWRPNNLFLISWARTLLQDIDRRYRNLLEAQHEFEYLDRAPLYMKLVQQMRLFVRQSHFNWKGDQLAFIRAVSNFYSAYSIVLRLLRQDLARGVLTIN